MKYLLACFCLVLVACQQEVPAPSPAVPDNLEPAAAAVDDKPMLPAYKLPGDHRPAKADQYDDFRNAHPELYGITQPPSVVVRPVAEYEPASRLMITVSSSGLPAGIWKNLVDVVKSGIGVVDVYVIYGTNPVKTAFTNSLAAAGVAASAVTWVNMAIDSIWVRDFGPLPIVSADNKAGIVDFRYYHQRIYDDSIPTKLGSLWNLSVFRAPVDFEGGNFMSDSKSNCFASQGLYYANGVPQAQVDGYMKSYVGCKNVYIAKPLSGEGTTHIDMQAKIVDDSTIVVGEYAAAVDATNDKITDDNAAYFQSLGYKVVRMPMPSNADGNFRTYINSLFVNGVNMVPVYSINKDKEAAAMAVWQQVMPTWQHVPMNSDDVIAWAGAIHCITMTVADATYAKMQTDPAYACGGDWACYPGGTGDNCGGIAYQGCCEGQTLKYCENNVLKTASCTSKPSCGWDSTNQYYNCGTAGAADPSGKYPKSCTPVCEPNCTGKVCGDDGCGGSCGTCAAGKVCQQGTCVTSGGPAQCLGPNTPSANTCGNVSDIGCCDELGRVLYCMNGALYCINCTQSNPSCGWNTQNSWYDCGTNGSADPSGKNPKACGGACVPACTGKVCGSDGCGGTCGTCPAGQVCNASGQCACVPNCTGKVCGDNGCGGSCGTCGAGQLCNAAGQCVNSCTPNCTGKVCGNDGCGGSCGTCQAGTTCNAAGQCVCAPNCVGKQCGPNGCGGSCGTCPAGSTCSASGQCVSSCVPDCSGKQCGPDGCGGICGTCQAGQTCDAAGKCVSSCVPNCTGKVCGSNGCGGSCGTCPAGSTCNASGQCVSSCVPACTNKQCGGDGCGGTCGTCPVGFECSADFKCVSTCKPDCTGKVCGDDGCGGTCGTCPANNLCQGGKCVPVADPCLGITWQGCCDGTSLYWCENSQLFSLACGTAGCGWNGGQQYYDCNFKGADPSGTFPLTCPGGQCIPDCAGKSCGDDGCGGSCGTCQAGQLCTNGNCVSGNNCGDVTYAGLCDGSILVWCENNAIHKADCSKLGPNYVCEFHPPKNGFYCIEKEQCTPTCTGKACGDDGCGGSCGTCPAGQSCGADGQCKPGPCVPACGGKACGPDGCGSTCGTCPAGGTCSADGQCVPVCTPVCEGKECGPDGCDGSCGTCPAGSSCQGGACEAGCVPVCTGKECGDDGCGGLCGTCPAGEVCTAGTCAPECTPACDGKACGPDGCGGDCGSCPKDFSCQDGLCVAQPDGCGNITSAGMCQGDLLKKCVANEVVTTDCAEAGKTCSFVPGAGVYDCVGACIPLCAGKECGDDGCGGNCGVCAKGYDCEAGKCIQANPVCTPSCEGRVCGSDGCDGSCGTCADGESCSGDGLCLGVTPQADVIESDTPSVVEPGPTEEPVASKSGGCSSASTSDAGGSVLLFLLLLGSLLTAHRSLGSRPSRCGVPR